MVPVDVVVEVVVLYGSTILDVQHLSDAAYTIGESPRTDLVLPPRGLPEPATFTLLRDKTLRFTASMHGEVASEGRTQTLEALVHEGRATRRGRVFEFPLALGTRCTVSHGPVTFRMSVVPREAPLRLDAQFSRPFWAWNVWSLLLFASVLVPVYLMAPSPHSPGEAVELEHELAAVGTFSTDTTPDAPEPSEDAPAETPDTGGHEGAPGLGSEDGEPAEESVIAEAEGAGRGRSTVGDGDGIGRGSGEASESTAMGGRGRVRSGRPVGRRTGPGSFRRLYATGTCPELDLLALEAKRYVHPSMLTLVGPCETPTPGGIPQMARNFDPDLMQRNAGILGLMQQQSGFLAPPPSVSNNAHAFGKTARVRQGKHQVKGGLDPDLVRRIVRAHINELRGCYAKGLTRRASLHGRVTVAFTVGTQGRVTSTNISHSSLADARVERCISRTVQRWHFPKPRGGGEVRVTYPLVFERN